MDALLHVGLQASWPLPLACLALGKKSWNGSPKWMQTLGGSPWSCHLNKKANTPPQTSNQGSGGSEEMHIRILQTV
jgi:hypothetical protein